MNYSNDQTYLRSIILEHFEKPRNKEVPQKENDYHYIHSKSPSCIDDFKLYIKTIGEKIIDIKYDGVGCAISTAATSIFSEILVNNNFSDAIKIIENYLQMVNGNSHNKETLGELICMSTLHKHPNRITCATISIIPLLNFLKEKQND